MIKMVDLGLEYANLKEEIDKALSDVMLSSSFINGPIVAEFASNLEKFCDVKKVIPCANGTDAIQLSLMSLGLKRGDEIIVPAHTYIASVEAIALLGLKPVLVDVDRDTFNINPELIESKITKSTKAIMPVHLYGQCAEMESILEIAQKYDLSVIEDTAQALGSNFYFSDGSIKTAGTLGTIGTTSFFPTKNLGCYGDGGAIFTNDEELGLKIKMLANHGQSKKYIHDLIGVNSRLDSMQAAILNVKLKYLNEALEKRKKAAMYYCELLKDFDKVQLPATKKGFDHTFHQFTLKIKGKDRDKVKAVLHQEGIPTMIYYPVPIHLQNAYKHFGYLIGDFPITEELSNVVLSLPIYPNIAKKDQEMVVEKLIATINNN